MADDKKTPETENAQDKAQDKAAENAAPEVTETVEVQAAKAAANMPEGTDAAAEKAEVPAVATTPSEAADNQNPAQEPSAQPTEQPRNDGRQGRGRGRGGDNRGGGRGRGGRDNRRGGRREEEDDGIIEKLVHINRVSKTVKGGKRFGFAALVVVGDGQGRVGFGKGKAREVPEAITKATAAARKKMIRVALKEGRTLHHDGNGRFGAGKVTLRTAPPGTGIIAGGPMRAVFESLGVADVVTKSVGTSNPYNMIRATFEALQEQTSPKSVAQRRGKKVADLLGRGGKVSEAEAEADAAAIAE
jgi:small subunit ribosomal protein S5